MISSKSLGQQPGSGEGRDREKSKIFSVVIREDCKSVKTLVDVGSISLCVL